MAFNTTQLEKEHWLHGWHKVQHAHRGPRSATTIDFRAATIIFYYQLICWLFSWIIVSLENNENVYCNIYDFPQPNITYSKSSFISQTIQTPNIQLTCSIWDIEQGKALNPHNGLSKSFLPKIHDWNKIVSN